MSGRIVGEVMECAPEDLRAGEFAVLLAIAEDARDRDRLARYSDVASIVHRTRGFKAGTVRNALSELARRGLIIPIHDNVHRGGRHQEYQVADLRPEHRQATNGHTPTEEPKLRRIQ